MKKIFKYLFVFGFIICVCFIIKFNTQLLNAAPWLGFGTYTTRQFLVTGTLTDFGSRWNWTDKFLDCGSLGLTTGGTCTSANIKNALNTTYGGCYIRDLEVLNGLIKDSNLSTGDYTQLIQKISLFCPSDTPIYNPGTPGGDYIVGNGSYNNPYRFEGTDMSGTTLANSCRYYNLNSNRISGNNQIRTSGKGSLSCSGSNCMSSGFYLIDSDLTGSLLPYSNYCGNGDKSSLVGDGSSGNPFRYQNEGASDANVKANSCYSYISGFIYQNYLSGMYRIDTDGVGGTGAFNVYCDMSNNGGGWTMIFNLQTSDSATRDYDDTGFWTSVTTSGAIAYAFSSDYKSDAYNTLPFYQIMMWGHNDGSYLGFSSYSLLSGYSGKTMYYLMNNITNTIATTTRLNNGGSIGTSGRSGNRGDGFIDRPYPIIINSSFSIADGQTYNRFGFNYSDLGIGNGHSYGGWGGRHYRGGRGAYYEGAAINTYCNAQGGYGSNGRGYNGNDAFQGCGPSLVPVDMAIFVK